ncbi:hypothetical protein MPH_05097 [Macrophomina phaseolina MS6]|uniref:Uncharacterized protein n=1 Tax=Macrophomina phaseolina (strain MS6) TaxID=1126212 RepID=K2RSG6_MACPH|nr:hypothetical protein MPH_05097 [Macrophomina phaseolina MS6]
MFGHATLALKASFVLLAGATYIQTPQEDFETRNFRTIQSIYNLTIFPNNAQIIAQGGSAVPPGLFDPQARGRITPLGNFTSFEDSIEYFFGLAPTPQGNAAGLGLYEADLVAFTSSCPEVAASVVYLKGGAVNNVTGGLLPGSPTTTLKQIAFWRFDDAGAVLLYDAWIPTLQLWTNVANGIQFENRTIQQGTIAQSLCPTIQQRCVGKDQQYQNVDDCTAQLLAKEFGTFDEVWGDNIVCRMIHVILTVIRPDIHCAHVGPTGGGKCVDIDYRTDYFDDAQLFGMAEPFKCPKLQVFEQVQGLIGSPY